jgi:hypothetical protein
LSETAAIAAAVEASSPASGSRSNSKTRCGDAARVRAGLGRRFERAKRYKINLMMRLAVALRTSSRARKRKDQSILLVKLHLQAGDFGILPVGGAIRRFQAHLLQIELKPAQRNGELRPQLILLGLHLFGGQRCRIDQIATGQPHRSPMNGREEHQHQQTARQQADTTQHQRFDHAQCFPETPRKVNRDLN